MDSSHRPPPRATRPSSAAAAPGPDKDAANGALGAALPQRVRALRQQRAFTRAQLSERSGISPAYLARVEAGTANLSLHMLERLAHALQVSPQSLLDDPVDYGEAFDRIVDFLKRQPAPVHAELWRWIDERYGRREASPDGARRIALVGLRGAGKSTLGVRLARKLGVPFVELNRVIERAGGVPVAEVFTLYGAAGYRTLERSCLEQVIGQHPAVVLATGGGLVSEPATYERLRGAFRTVWLRARPEEHFERVRRQQDARIAAPALRDVAMANIRAMMAAREPLYALADLALDTSGRSPAESLRELAALVATAPAHAHAKRHVSRSRPDRPADAASSA